MIHHILLQGGAEFGGQMAASDQRAMEQAGGPAAPIRIIPAAAAPDNNHERAGQNGVRWFQSLGATNVRSVPLLDRASADESAIAAELRQSKLIYLLGGFPHHLAQSLKESASWRAIQQALADGAVIAGSSAGAMVLCSDYANPSGGLEKGLALVPNSCLLPHHNTFGRGWAARLAQQLPHTTLIGIDERTGMFHNPAAGRWEVLGQGQVTLYQQGKPEIHPPGAIFTL